MAYDEDVLECEYREKVRSIVRATVTPQKFQKLLDILMDKALRGDGSAAALIWQMCTAVDAPPREY
jgi:hypothetical protein